MQRQATNLEVTSIQHQNDIEKKRGKIIDISSVLKFESTSSYPRRIDVSVSTWIRLS